MRLTTLLFALALLPAAAAADQNNECFRINPNDTPDAANAACSDFLATGLGGVQLRSEAFANRGIARRELGRLDDSVADLEQSVALDAAPNHLRMLAWTYREMNQPDKAEAIYTKVLETDDHWQGWLSRCVVRQDQSNYQQAVTDCEEALARDPENLDALYFAARAYNFLSDGARALPLAEKAASLAPQDARHVVEIVWGTYFTQGPTAARQRAQDGLQAFPDNGELQSFLEKTGQ